MEQATLLQIARLRTMSAKKSKAFDVVRFASDREFAKTTLKDLCETDDEELIVAALQMMDRLRMITAANSTTKPSDAALKPLPAKAPETAKYVGRLR